MGIHIPEIVEKELVYLENLYAKMVNLETDNLNHYKKLNDEARIKHLSQEVKRYREILEELRQFKQDIGIDS